MIFSHHPAALVSVVIRRIYIFLLLLTVAGCAVNPVTGRQELHLVSSASEIDMGVKNYLPAQQSQGGLYYLDSVLTSYVKQTGMQLVQVSDRPQLPYDFVVLNNSVPNAWALPGGKIAVNRGLLLELENKAELAAVLAHEIVHAAARHSAKAVERGMLLQAGTLGVGMAVAGKDSAKLLVGAASLGATLINQRYTREQELEADYYGMVYMARAGYDPRAAITLQEKFVRLNKERRRNWLTGLFATHPPSQERVNANRANAKKMAPGDVIGREEYLARIGSLQKTKQAYSFHDEGQKALIEKNFSEAYSLAEKAISVEPREAFFYGLKGDSFLARKQYQDAIREYNEAIRRNDGYFLFYLGRGRAERQLGMSSEAWRDLEQSNTLLPTAIANYELGELAIARNRPDLAVQHFRTAASSNSPLGQQAGVRLVELELPRQPERYIRIEWIKTLDGRIALRARNNAPVAVQRLTVQARILQNQFHVLDEENVYFPFRLNPGETFTKNTHLKMIDPTKGESVHVRIISVDIVK